MSVSSAQGSVVARGAIHGHVLLVLALVLLPLWLWADAPAWWTERGVLNPTATADDYAAVNQGQVKHIAKQAYEEINAKLPGGAGIALSGMWTSPAASTDDYQAINLGQLKNVAEPFYDRLLAVGYTGQPLTAGQVYPWEGATSADDYALANIGQVKNLFSFDLSAPEGQLPEWWQTLYFGNVSVDPNADPDGDGFSNLEEYLAGTIPTNYYSRPGGDLNLPPVVTVIGEHTLIWPENGLTLVALALDTDNGPQPLSYAWSKESGPGTVTFASSDQSQTAVQFSQIGTYLLKIETSDGEATAAAVVAINILSAAEAAPTVQFIAPDQGAQLNQGEEFVLWVKAADFQSGIDTVALYRNGALLETKQGSDITSYLFSRTESALGAVTFTAVATNSSGVSASASIALSFFPSAVGAPPGGSPPGSPGSGNPPSGPGANVPGNLQQLTLPTAPLGMPEEFSVFTWDMEEISDEHEYTGDPGEFVLLEVVVYSAEYPYYTGQQSEYDDAVSWTVAPAWGQSKSGAHRVNALHEKFNEDGEAIVGYFGIRFPTDVEPAARKLTFKVTVQNIADGVLDTGVQFRLVRMGMAVDADRDGEISLDAPADMTTPRKPYVFWSNDDDDELFDQSVLFLYNELSEDDRDTAVTNVQDWQDNKIDSLRDLEDFARLHISLGGMQDAFRNGQLHLGLKWTDTGGTSPSLKLYRSADPAGSSSYLFNTTVAGQQIAQTAIIDARHPDYDLSNTNFASNHTVIGGSETFVLRTILLNGLTATNFTVPFLFEVCSPGKGQLKLVILKKEGETYTEIGEGPGVWFEFKRPGELVERYSCGDAHLGAVSAVHRHANSGQFPAPTNDEERDYVLYVHGYNMKEFEKQRWIETTFKRLYWLGYKGRVGGFTWPCAQSFLPFDASEERAWSSAAELKTHLENLKARGYRVHVLAHSQGNVVMGEALRQAGPGTALASTYIATQAAVAASCYKENVPLMPNPGQETPDVYGTYPPTSLPYFDGSAMSGAASRYVNFYNRNDYALSSTSGNLGSWEKDQQLKPNQGWGYNAVDGFFESNTWGGLTSRRFPNDRFRIFSYGAEAKSLALGTIPTGGVFTDFTNLSSSYGYGNHHIYHSGQFRASMAERYQYWMGLLDAALIPRISP